MAVNKDFYEVLGVDRNADADTIKKAHRKLAMQHHPDRITEDKDASNEKFKEIQQAYDTLSDPDKKRKYDQFGSGHDAFGSPSWSGGEIPTAGSDLQAQMDITLEESFTGGTRTFHYNRQVNCESCRHTGVKAGATSDKCKGCNGSGQVVVSGFNGRFQVKHICGACRGKGVTIKPENRCELCEGSGRSKRAEAVSVKIPRGIATGEYSVYEGYGEAGTNKGPFGNLIVIFMVKEHPNLKRVNGDDLLYELKTSFVDMCLGTTATVSSPKGSVTVTIPAETPNGRVLRITDYGMKNERTGRQGHLLVKLMADTPTELTDNQKKLLVSFQKEEQDKKEIKK